MAGVASHEEIVQVREIVRRSSEDLANRVRALTSALPEPRVESVFWRDSAMGIHPAPGETVTHRHTPGYILTFHVGSVRHRYHASEDGHIKYDGSFEVRY